MAMHVISLKALRAFWSRYPEAESALRRWHQVVESATWNTFADIRGTFSSADSYQRCVIFNVGGNKYRIIAAVHYDRRKVYLRNVLTHAEYDRGDWKADCQPE